MTLVLPPRKFIATVGPPRPDESLRGYLGRALSVTAVRNFETLLKLADARKGNAVSLATMLTDAGEIERISTLIGCTPEDIASRTYRTGQFAHSGSESIDFFGTQIRLHFRETKFRRVSPRALAIDPIHRAPWELRPLANDPQTREKMLTVCPACGQKLGWLRADAPYLCDRCDADLRDFPQLVSPVEDEEAYAFVTGLVDPDPAKKEVARKLLPEAWREFPNGDLFETAIALANGLALDPVESENVGGRPLLRRQFDKLEPNLLGVAGRAIIGGESGFSLLCDRQRAGMDGRRRQYGRQKELGPLAVISRDLTVNPKIRQLLAKFIRLNLEGTSDRFFIRKGQDASGSTRSIEALAATLGVQRVILQGLAESGFVSVFRAPSGPSPVHMAIDEVAPLFAQMADAVGERKAAAMLGLPVSAMPNINEHHLIKRLEGAVRGLLPGYVGYHMFSINSLIDRIWRSANPRRGRGCSIMVAARSIGTGETPWGAVISAIVSGDAEVFHNGAFDRAFRFGLFVEDVPSFVAAVRKHLHVPHLLDLPHFIGRATTAEILQITEGSLSQLVKACPDLFPVHGARDAPYARSEMRDLADNIIFVPEFARRGKLQPRKAVAWLRNNGAVPTVSARGNRDFGYPRSAVEPLLNRLKTETEELKLGLRDAAGTVRGGLIASVAGGVSIRDAARAAQVPYSEAQHWVAVWRKTGAVAPRKVGRASKLDDHEAFLRRIVDEQPMIKLVKICEALEQHGVKTNSGSVRSALDRLGIDLAARRTAEVEARLTGTTAETAATAQLKAALAEAGDTVRTRLIAAVVAGAAINVTAKAMDVPYRMAKRWIGVWRKTSAFALRKHGKASKLDEHEDFVRKLLDDRPNIKLTAIREALAEQGITASDSTVWLALVRFDIRLRSRRATGISPTSKSTSPKLS